MLDWINKLVGGDDAPTPATAQAGAAFEPLATWLRESQQHPGTFFGARLDERLIDHLLTGESVSVLTEQRALEWMANRANGVAARIYAGFNELPPAVALRWAKLIAQGWASTFRGASIPAINGSHWVEAVMTSIDGESPHSFRSRAEHERSLYQLRQIEAMLEADGQPASWLVMQSFATATPGNTYFLRGPMMLARAPDYPQALDRHLEVVRPWLSQPDVSRRLHAINLLERASAETVARLGAEIAAYAASESKQVRAAAAGLVARAADAIVAPLRAIAVDGAPEQRQFALRQLMQRAQAGADAALAAFVRETAAADKARSVRDLVAQWSASGTDEAALPRDDGVLLPTIDWSAAVNAVAPATLEKFWRLVDLSIDKANLRAREHHAQYSGRFPLHQWAPFSVEEKASLAQFLASSDMRPAVKVQGNTPRTLQHAREAAMLIAPQLTPVAALRLLVWFEEVDGAANGELAYMATGIFNTMHAATQRPTLLELGLMLAEAGYAPGLPLRNYCMSYGGALAHDWADDAVWPYFAHHVAQVEQLLLTPPRHVWSHDPARVFRAIAMLPRPPASLVDTLFQLALGSAKVDRAHAQAALAAHPGKEERLVVALGDGKAEVRQVAAAWLARLRDAPALDALEKAVVKEKNDVAKGAMLDALQALGQPVEKYIDRAAIARDAPKALAKGIPKDIDWFPWQALPVVHWADTGEAVPADVLRWLLVQAFKQKSPEPNAVLRKLCGLMDARDREAFGQFVLEVWLVEDVKGITPDALGNPYASHQAVGSAIASKGVLAIAAACAGERAAAPTQRYLKLWYGMRAAQGKALIAMLAWIEHPGATQLMLSIGSRFRTKSFQEEATRQAEALADRKGWTLAELADRTIPSGGFDESGTLELSYGERRFTARLLPDFKVELFNPEGKKIAALPEPRQDDDDAAAKASKKALSAARKEIRSIVDLQADRLYEALCTERDWPAADWRDYLLAHPVMRHLVQRLVWTWTTDDGRTQSFRPLDDGTLTSRDDDELDLPPDARVRIAHDSNLPADEAQAWQQHLVDYAVKPLFTQFGKGSFTLPAGRGRDNALKDFEGHMLEAFALRGRALKLGYTRGSTEDGGWFYSYDKRFPTLGLQAVIRFTGNPLPEANRAVALESLTFERTGPNAGRASTMALSTVPAVLLSECYDDLRLIAADGTGFDPDWQKKSEA